MSSRHDHLVFQLWIGTGNLSDGVVALFVVASKFRINRNGDSDRHGVREEAANPAEVLAREHRGRNGLLVIGQKAFSSHLLAVVITEHPTVTPPTRNQKRLRMLFGKEFCNPLFEVEFLKHVFPEG